VARIISSDLPADAARGDPEEGLTTAVAAVGPLSVTIRVASIPGAALAVEGYQYRSRSGGMLRNSLASADPATGTTADRFAAGFDDAAIERYILTDGSELRAGRSTLLLDWTGGDALRIALQGSWNSVKSIELAGFSGHELVVENFVEARLRLGSSLNDLRIVLDGSKRGQVETGFGDDRIGIRADSNGGAASLNTFQVWSGDGADEVVVGASARDWTEGWGGRYDAAWTRTEIDTGAGADRVTGGDGIDRIMLGAGNDLARGRGGNDQADGGGGYDTWVLSGFQSGYEVTRTGDVILVRDLDPTDGDEGTDRLEGFERLRFADDDQEVTTRFEILFQGATFGNGAELWRANDQDGDWGTTADARIELVAELLPGAAGSEPGQHGGIQRVGDAAFFLARVPGEAGDTTELALCRYRAGEVETLLRLGGTEIVADLAVSGDRVRFVARSADGDRLYEVEPDDTVSSVALAAPVRSGLFSDGSDGVFFLAEVGDGSRQWFRDVAGSGEVEQVSAVEGGFELSSSVEDPLDDVAFVAGRLCFVGRLDGSGSEAVWILNPEDGSVRRVTFENDAVGGDFSGLLVDGGRVLVGEAGVLSIDPGSATGERLRLGIEAPDPSYYGTFGTSPAVLGRVDGRLVVTGRYIESAGQFPLDYPAVFLENAAGILEKVAYGSAQALLTLADGSIAVGLRFMSFNDPFPPSDDRFGIQISAEGTSTVVQGSVDLLFEAFDGSAFAVTIGDAASSLIRFATEPGWSIDFVSEVTPTRDADPRYLAADDRSIFASAVRLLDGEEIEAVVSIADGQVRVLYQASPDVDGDFRPLNATLAALGTGAVFSVQFVPPPLDPYDPNGSYYSIYHYTPESGSRLLLITDARIVDIVEQEGQIFLLPEGGSWLRWNGAYPEERVDEDGVPFFTSVFESATPPVEPEPELPPLPDGARYAIRVGEAAYFAQGEPATDVLIRLNPDGTLTEIQGLPADARLEQLTAGAGTAWFTADDGVYGLEAWRVEGDRAVVTDLNLASAFTPAIAYAVALPLGSADLA